MLNGIKISVLDDIMKVLVEYYDITIWNYKTVDRIYLWYSCDEISAAVFSRAAYNRLLSMS
jgi:hypothetical protein